MLTKSNQTENSDEYRQIVGDVCQLPNKGFIENEAKNL